MALKKILGVGFSAAPTDIEYVSFTSKTSLLDWDIVLYRPKIPDYYIYGEKYQGKPLLDENASFALKESCEHWRREIKQLFDGGKTVVVFLSGLQEVCVHTGQRTYSGTGRNQKTTYHVEIYNNYQSIPISLSPLSSAGNEMKLIGQDATVLSSYWSSIGKYSTYQVQLQDLKAPACLVTRTGDKPVGFVHRDKSSNGALLLLPDIDFESGIFIKEENHKKYWTPEAKKFAGLLVSSIVALDKELQSSSEQTPQPDWASSSDFDLDSEDRLRSELLVIEQKIKDVQRIKEKIIVSLREAGKFRALLFEKGRALEFIVIEALRLLGFVANNFKESESEFDVVFECAEGRLIGEVEGKDNKPVNIEKMRQLSMNIHEDLQRDEVKSPAKPVLFGNGFRLEKLNERANPFTDKCHSAAISSSTALVFTPDLFYPIQYILKRPNENYSRECRLSILNGIGRVKFPPIPQDDFAPAGGETGIVLE